MMRSRLRITLLLLLGALGSGLLLLTPDFGTVEGRRTVPNLHKVDGITQQQQHQQYRQYEVLPDDFKSAERDTASFSTRTWIPKIWNSNTKGEIKTYPNLAQCQILHHRTSSSTSANITSISLLLDPKRFSRFRNVFDARCGALHQGLLANIRTEESKELLRGFVCGSDGSWKTGVFLKVFEEDIEDAKGVLRTWAPEVRWREEGVCEKGTLGAGEWVREREVAGWKREEEKREEHVHLEERGNFLSAPQNLKAKPKSPIRRPSAGVAIYHGFQGTNQNKDKPSICQLRTSPHHKSHLGVEAKLYRISKEPKKDPCPQVKSQLKQLGWNFGGVDKGFRCVYSAQEHAMSMLAIINAGSVDKKDLAVHLEQAWKRAGLEYTFVCFDDDETTQKAKKKEPEKPEESLLFPGWQPKMLSSKNGDRKGGADNVSPTLFAEPEEFTTGNNTSRLVERNSRVAGGGADAGSSGPDGQQSQESKVVLEDSSNVQPPPTHPQSSGDTLSSNLGSPPPYPPHPSDGKGRSVKPMERRGQSQSTGSRPPPNRIRGKCLVTDIGSTYFSIWRYDIEVQHPTKRLSLQSTCRSLENIVKKKSHIAIHVECDLLASGKGVHFIISGDKRWRLDLVGLTHELEERFPFNEFKCLASAPRYFADQSAPDYIDAVYGRLRRTGCLVYKHTVPNHPTIQNAQVMALVPGVPYSEAECERARGTWGRRHGDYDRMWMCEKVDDPDPQRSGGIYISAMGSVDLFTDPTRASALLQEVWYGPIFDCKPGHEFDGS